MIPQAPLNTECVTSADPGADYELMALDEPSGRADADFDDAQWVAATVRTTLEVSSKEG